MGLTQLFNHLRPALPWNSLMDKMLDELHIQRKRVNDISECLKGIPLHSQVIAVIQSAHALGCDLKVVSDSNLFYIKTILQHYKIYNCFSNIITNPALVDEQERLKIFPYHKSHACHLCPSNLCKLLLDQDKTSAILLAHPIHRYNQGRVIEQIQASVSKSESKILIYIGDDMNDFCPTLKLVKGDSVMARKNFPLLGHILENSQIFKAKVYEWRNDEDLAIILHKLITEKSNDDKINLLTSQL